MLELRPSSLWIGNAGDLHGPIIETAEIKAVVQLALEERMPDLSRELLLVHIPLMDGAGNPPALVRFAIDTTAGLVRAGIPTLVCCSNGMSRSPCIAAAALSSIDDRHFSESLKAIIHDRPHDISPALADAVANLLAR